MKVKNVLALMGVVVLFTSSQALLAQIDTTKEPYNLQVNSVLDQSDALQAALNEANARGGDTVLLPAGVIYVQGVQLFNDVTIQGKGWKETTLKLVDNAAVPSAPRPYILGTRTYVQSLPWDDLYGGLRGLTLDGNKENNFEADLLVIGGYRFFADNCRFTNSPRHGVLMTSGTAAGTRGSLGAENSFVECLFDDNFGAGLYCENPFEGLADTHVLYCEFRNNGAGGYNQLYMQRAAGAHVVGNYFNSAAGIGNMSLRNSSATNVCLNYFDGTGIEAIDGVARNVDSLSSGWGHSQFADNVFINFDRKSVSDWQMLNLAVWGQEPYTSIFGNSFMSANEAGRAINKHGKTDYVFETASVAELKSPFEQRFAEGFVDGRLSGQGGWYGGGDAFQVDTESGELRVTGERRRRGWFSGRTWL